MIPKEIKYNLHYDDVRGDFYGRHTRLSKGLRNEFISHGKRAVGFQVIEGLL